MYFACRPLSPLDVDEMELWQIAAYLGAHRPPDVDDGPESGSEGAVRSAPMDRATRNRELNRQRLAAARGERAAPTHDDVRVTGADEAQVMQFRRTLGA